MAQSNSTMDYDVMYERLEIDFRPETTEELKKFLSDIKALLTTPKLKKADIKALEDRKDDYSCNVERLQDLLHIVAEIPCILKKRERKMKEQRELKKIKFDEEKGQIDLGHNKIILTLLKENERLKGKEKEWPILDKEKDNIEILLAKEKEMVKMVKSAEKRARESEKYKETVQQIKQLIVDLENRSARPERLETNASECGETRTSISYIDSKSDRSSKQVGTKDEDIKIAYKTLISERWHSAKELMDEKLSGNDAYKLKILCDTIMVLWRSAKLISKFVKVHELQISAPREADHFLDHQNCLQLLDDHFAGANDDHRKIWALVKGSREIQDYIMLAADIVVAMVLQKPHLELRLSNTYLGPTYQDWYQDNFDLSTRHSKDGEIHHLCPILLSGSYVLVKGRVCRGESAPGQSSEFVCLESTVTSGGSEV